MGPGRIFLPVAILAAVAALANPASAQDGQAGESFFVSGRDLSLSPPPGGGALFRFLPDSPWAAFERSLFLSAAEGEARLYRVEVDPDGAGGSSVAAYLIDKHPPAPPRADPAGGLFRAAVAPRLMAEEGGRVLWSLVGPGKSATAFIPYTGESRPSIEPSPSGSSTWTVIAYAEDDAGNRSRPIRFVYRLAAPGLEVESPTPEPDAPGPSADAGLDAPSVYPVPGSTEISLPLPMGSSLLVAVNPGSAPSRLDDFSVIPSRGGVATLRLACPYGWAGELDVFYGVLQGGKASFNPTPLSVTLSDAPIALPPPADPQAPSLVADPAGRASFIVFPSYDGLLMVSMDGAQPVAYEEPLPTPAGARRVKVAWYGEDGRGERSALSETIYDLPQPVPDISLTGVQDGAYLGQDVTLTPSSPGVLRYELRQDGKLPPEPGAGSALLGPRLVVPCPPGEERSYVLRYRAFADQGSGSIGGEGRILRFTIDRKSPAPPRTLAAAPAYSDRSLFLSLAAGEGDSIFVSLSADGGPAPWMPASGPVELPGDESGPVTYFVKAYAVDPAGNRSVEMEPVSLVVDRSSVYAAQDAVEGGDGSPGRPFRKLDAALDAARRSGKRSVNLRGSLELGMPFVAAAPVDLVGGFAADWARDRSARATIVLSLPPGASAFATSGPAMGIRGVDIVAPAAGSAPILLVEDAGLRLEDVGLRASGAGDIVLLRALRSKVSVFRSRLLAERAMSCTAVDAESSDVEIEDSSVSARPAVRVFGALDLDGGSLRATGTLLESSADLAINLVSARRASLVMDRCLLRVDSGTGFLRLGSFSGSSGEIRSSKFLVAWRGGGTLFEFEGGGPNFVYDSVLARNTGGELRFFDVTGAVPRVWNCIMSSDGGSAEFLRSGSAPGPGALVADCLWGFGRLVAVPGMPDIVALGDLDALNASSALYSSRRHLSEPSSASFEVAAKGVSSLRPGSACVDSAFPVEGPYGRDFDGSPRPSTRGKRTPDIGADELGD